MEIKKGIYWVGAIDWDLRNFHGYRTQRGSTYNAYLIVDEKVVLVDTVKACVGDQMLENIRKIIDPSKIDMIVCNHVEMDHSGCLPMIKELAPNATILTSASGEKGLKKHFHQDWDFQIVKTGDSICLGRTTLQFVLTPMVHWPDSMVTYIPEQRLLLPNDGFGQHIASSQRFDDQLDWGIVKEEATKYYANIVMPYGTQVSKVLETVAGLEVDMIAPSHGLIFRSHIAEIIELYHQWAKNETEHRAVIIYDSMWGSTKSMAYALKEVFAKHQIEYEVINLQTNHVSDVITRILTAEYICVGSPTLNNTILASVAGFLTYLEGLSPKNRKAIAFGSYGWSGQSVGIIEESLKRAKCTLLTQGLKVQYKPTLEELEEFTINIENALIKDQ